MLLAAWRGAVPSNATRFKGIFHTSPECWRERSGRSERHPPAKRCTNCKYETSTYIMVSPVSLHRICRCMTCASRMDTQEEFNIFMFDTWAERLNRRVTCHVACSSCSRDPRQENGKGVVSVRIADKPPTPWCVLF